MTLQLAAMNGLSAPSGVLVTGYTVAGGSRTPARRGGMQVGDIIVAMNGQPITSSAALTAATASQLGDAGLACTVTRGTSQVVLTIRLRGHSEGSDG